MRNKYGVKTRLEAETASRELGLSEQYGLEAIRDIMEAVRLSKRHCRIQERWCSEQMDEKTTRRLKDTERRIEEKITKIALKYSLGVNFSGDPRGYTVKFLSNNGAHNTWGGKESGYGLGSP